IVDVYEDFHAIAVARERFVDGIVYNLVNQMMQTELTGRADVHRRSLSHGLAAFKNCDRSRAVLLWILGHSSLLEKRPPNFRFSLFLNQAPPATRRQTEVCRTSHVPAQLNGPRPGHDNDLRLPCAIDRKSTRLNSSH